MAVHPPGGGEERGCLACPSPSLSRPHSGGLRLPLPPCLMPRACGSALLAAPLWPLQCG